MIFQFRVEQSKVEVSRREERKDSFYRNTRRETADHKVRPHRLLQSRSLTISHSHGLTVSHSHSLTVSQSHSLTVSQSHSLTVSHRVTYRLQ